MEDIPTEYNQKQIYIIFGILAVILGSLAFFLLITSVVWVPALIMGSPLLLLLYAVFKYSPVGSLGTNLYLQIYDWLFYKSDQPRRFLWGLIYNLMCLLYPNSKWRAMNYGYALLTSDGFSIQNLEEQDEQERFCLQLYHFLATGFHQNSTLKGLKVLQVGSGRGGGLNYISQYLNPSECFGVDLSENQIEFCQRNYQSNNKLKFFIGDSENLDQIPQLEPATFDLAINVESSHCYGNFRKFVDQVFKFLKPKGVFAFTDFRTPEDIPKLKQDFTDAGFKIVKEEDITLSVVQALKFDGERRVQLIEGKVFQFLRGFFKKFSGVSGTRIYNELSSRQTLYMAYILQKP